ncbi:hypothetical protein [Microbulbifer sp. TRSA005]|uniref:hypothetical protein n=1 Tax=Microbulbifer sp. TRSA005 TaxID=3243383 RepID=UPI0040395EF6
MAPRPGEVIDISDHENVKDFDEVIAFETSYKYESGNFQIWVLAEENEDNLQQRQRIMKDNGWV